MQKFQTDSLAPHGQVSKMALFTYKIWNHPKGRQEWAVLFLYVYVFFWSSQFFERIETGCMSRGSDCSERSLAWKQLQMYQDNRQDRANLKNNQSNIPYTVSKFPKRPAPYMHNTSQKLHIKTIISLWKIKNPKFNNWNFHKIFLIKFLHFFLEFL